MPSGAAGVCGVAAGVSQDDVLPEKPIASVAALRETSILIVMLLSMRVLKETVSLPRLAGAVLIVIGAVLIRLA